MKNKYLMICMCGLLLAGCTSKYSSYQNSGTKDKEVSSVIDLSTKESQEPTIEETSEPTPQVSEEPVLDFTSGDSLLLLANKSHKLPDGYAPSDLVTTTMPCSNGTAYMRVEANNALTSMYNDAQNDGVSLMISSAYRSESYQTSLYNGYVSSYGAASADRISSRPGYSDHQTGLACDFVNGLASDFEESFESTSSGIWLAQHAHEYGFIMRYPKGKEEITGYSYEPWHFRYIGVDYATKMYEQDPTLTFEEYFNVSGGDYLD